MRDRETIDSELRALAAEHRSIRRNGGNPSSRQIDALLDERLGHPIETSEKPLRLTRVEPTLSLAPDRGAAKPAASRLARKSVLRRFGLLAALPISMVAGAAVLAMLFAVREPHPAAQPEAAPPSAGQPNPPPMPAAPPPPPNHPPPLAIVDRALIDTLKQEGVPVPSDDYVMKQGHAVCDFLTQQPDFTQAVHFVQQSSIWDADQSTQLAAGAVISYCPQQQATNSAQMDQTFQKALSDLQAIQGDLQGIRDALPNRQP
jgi:hypothetical protein